MACRVGAQCEPRPRGHCRAQPERTRGAWKGSRKEGGKAARALMLSSGFGLHSCVPGVNRLVLYKAGGPAGGLFLNMELH